MRKIVQRRMLVIWSFPFENVQNSVSFRAKIIYPERHRDGVLKIWLAVIDAI